MSCSRAVRATAVCGILAAFVGFAGAGCEASGSASHSPASGRGEASHDVTTGWAAAGAHGMIGVGCGWIPAAGPGSIGDMASAPVMGAVAHTRLLTEIAHAIQAADLTGRLNAAKAITVFAPDDAAFGALGRGNLTTLLADKSDLIRVIEYHVVSGRQTPADLASGRHLTTLLGTVIIPAKSHGKYRVNNAQVICGGIQTANATVYIVNKILVPIP